MTPEELAHQKRVAGYLAKIKRLWQQATDEAAAMAGKVIGYDPTKPFNIINYPQTSKEMNKIISELHDQTQFLIEEGIDMEWYNANKNNDRLVKNWSKNKPRPPEQWMQHNEDARDAFKIRKEAGMNLSDRVWKITKEHKVNLEMAIDMSLHDGKSAQLLSQDIRQSLNDPNRLYRRVRDARGNLQLSKAAQGYHSGQGVYRSSYKNAMRVARTENNLAYRYSDFYRTAQLDFVVGYVVHLSGSHSIPDICDELKGKYPKEFKFGGWHPQCWCYTTTVLMDEDEFNMIEDRMLAGEDISKYVSPNTIWDTPKGFNDWVQQNIKRSEGWKSQPYWVRDNFKGGTLGGGLQIGKAVPPKTWVPPTPPPVPPPVPNNILNTSDLQTRDQWREKMAGVEIDPNKQAAFQAYRDHSYWGINQYLRYGIENSDTKYISSVREYINDMPKVNGALYRGAGMTDKAYNNLISQLDDGYFMDKGFSSFTVSEDIARTFIDSDTPHLVEFIMDAKGKNGIFTNNAAEMEVLFMDSTRFKAEYKVVEKIVRGEMRTVTEVRLIEL